MTRKYWWAFVSEATNMCTDSIRCPDLLVVVSYVCRRTTCLARAVKNGVCCSYRLESVPLVCEYGQAFVSSATGASARSDVPYFRRLESCVVARRTVLVLRDVKCAFLVDSMPSAWGRRFVYKPDQPRVFFKSRHAMRAGIRRVRR